jgi:hypothetical protein
MLSLARDYYFDGRELTRDRCEEFFSCEDNFYWSCPMAGG